jgi:hypothetical protein
MRSLMWIGATLAIVVMSSTAAGQKRIPNPVVDRLLSFAGSGDDRIARDELPERMQGLISRGDRNLDGFLTPDEVIALVETRATGRQIQRFEVRNAASLADLIADLKLPPVTRDRAMEIVKDRTVPRSIDDPAGASVYTAMRELLDDEDYENFVASVARLRHTSRVFVGGVGGAVLRTPAPAPREPDTIPMSRKRLVRGSR